MTPTAATLTRHFDAPPEALFDAWLDPAWIGRWMFGPTVRDERIRRLAVDPRVSGRFSFEVERLGQGIVHVGEYLALERPVRLAFTWGLPGQVPARVEVLIAATAGGCDLTLSHGLPAEFADAADRTRDAWAAMLETLDRELHPADGRAHATGPGALRLERLLPGPLERVWEHLVDPDKRSQWLAGGPLEVREGGAVELVFRHAGPSDATSPAPEIFSGLERGHLVRGRVTAVQPPAHLAFTWGPGPAPSEVALQLRAQGTQVRLTLLHSGLADAATREAASAGWHAHVDALADCLHGHEPTAFAARHAALAALYRQRESNG